MYYIVKQKRKAPDGERVEIMKILRIFRLTDEAEKRGIAWNNFNESDIETVEEIEVEADDERTTDEIAYDAGYSDTDTYGYEWIK